MLDGRPKAFILLSVDSGSVVYFTQSVNFVLVAAEEVTY